MVQKTISTKLDNESQIYQTINGLMNAENISQSKAIRILLNKGMELLLEEQIKSLLPSMRNAIKHEPPQLIFKEPIKDETGILFSFDLDDVCEFYKKLEDFSDFYGVTMADGMVDILCFILKKAK